MLSHNLYTRVLQPFKIGENLSLKNRIFFSSMGIDICNAGGTASKQLINFYKGIIEGGPGMVILGNASIHPSSRLQEKGLGLHDEQQAKALRPLFKIAKEHHCELVVQLQHYGAQGCMPLSGAPLLSPSGIPCNRMKSRQPNYKTVAMSHNDIKQVRYYFLQAAQRAELAGAKTIQLQAANGYLLSSFLSPYTNVRNDKYGGSSLNRMRLLYEVVDDIRTACPNLSISVRLGIDDGFTDKGQYPELLAPHIQRLEALGVTSLSLSMTTNETLHLLLNVSEKARQRFYTGISVIRNATSIPIGFSGFTANLEQAEHVIQLLNIDLIGMTRALFADNNLIVKTQQGNEKDIHKCRFDSNCIKDKSNPELDRVYCCVNPRYLRPTHISYK